MARPWSSSIWEGCKRASTLLGKRNGEILRKTLNATTQLFPHFLDSSYDYAMLNLSPKTRGTATGAVDIVMTQGIFFKAVQSMHSPSLPCPSTDQNRQYPLHSPFCLSLQLLSTLNPPRCPLLAPPHRVISSKDPPQSSYYRTPDPPPHPSLPLRAPPNPTAHPLSCQLQVHS